MGSLYLCGSPHIYGRFGDGGSLKLRGPQNFMTPVCKLCLWIKLHVLSCPKGGFPSIRHNEVGSWMSEVCHDVYLEPHLQPMTGETLNGASAITEDGARLDIAVNGFWVSKYERCFFDV